MNSEPAPADKLTRPLAAIGDVHGRLDLLEGLLARLDLELGQDAYDLVFLGDYVDRGPDSAAVLDCLVDLQARRPETVFLKGNHEQAMVDFLAAGPDADGWLSWGGLETLASYGIDVDATNDEVALQHALADKMPTAHFAFLMELKATHRVGRYFFAHAGVNPDRALTDQVEKDLLWIRDRFFQHGDGKFPETVIVHGHTPVKTSEDHGWRINVDTGAVWTGKLSAVVFGEDTPRFFST